MVKGEFADAMEMTRKLGPTAQRHPSPFIRLRQSPLQMTQLVRLQAVSSYCASSYFACVVIFAKEDGFVCVTVFGNVFLIISVLT
jgi:hypothetical protein